VKHPSAPPKLRIKRVYEPAEVTDGARVLVDRVWPRGVTKERAALDLWLKDIAPSSTLRKWFGHDPARWDAFRSRYLEELRADGEAVNRLRDLLERGPVTLIYAAHDDRHNHALVIQDYISSL
jgi:uncharacterized protein YeaO (DUF488 family)